MLHWLAHRLGLKSCPQCETLVDYALDGLAPVQQEQVRKHLEECPPCREQVRDFWQVKEGLGLCCPERAVPAGFSGKVLARLNEPDAAPPAPAKPAHLGGWPRFWMTLGPVFAVATVLLASLTAMALTRRPGPAPVASEMVTLSTALLSDPHAATVLLSGAGRATAKLVLCKGMDHAYLRYERLAPCPRGINYAVWMRPAGGTAVRLARFEVDASAACEQLLSLPQAFRERGPVDFMVKEEGGAQPKAALLTGSVTL